MEQKRREAGGVRSAGLWTGAPRDRGAEAETRTTYRPRRPGRVAVTGISRGCGATFIAMSLAFLLSKQVESQIGDETGTTKGTAPTSASTPASMPLCAAYVEMERPAADCAQAYFIAGLDQRFRRRRFTDFFALAAAGEPLAGRINLHRGVNWVVWPPQAPLAGYEGMALTQEHLAELPASWIVADRPPLSDLRGYDLVIAIIDPAPAALYAGAETFEILRNTEDEGQRTIWIVNHDDMAVNHADMRRFLRLRPEISIPALPAARFYEAAYADRLTVELFSEAEREPLEQLAAAVRQTVPPSILM